MTSAPGGPPVYTIGHSTRTIDEFRALLNAAAIQVLADVRSTPRSRRNPQFNLEVLPGSLGEFGVRYQHLPELGGRRHRAPNALASPNTFWRHKAFRNYADYAMTATFASGMARLRDLARAGNCALMCSEAVWWRCHRRIVSDYLLTLGFQVLHILGPRRIEIATLTIGAERQFNGTLIYRVVEAPTPGVRK